MKVISESQYSVNLDTLLLKPIGLVPPDTRFRSIAPEAHFRKMPEVPAPMRPLINTSASYAGLTLRHATSAAEAASAYPLLLLVGWLWDDLVDHHKDVPGIELVISDTLRRFAEVLCVDWKPVSPEATKASVSPALQTAADSAVNFLKQADQLIGQELPEYSARIRRAFWDFLHSFEAKADLRHHQTHSIETYTTVRARCVGMLPCFELAYALKASLYGVSPSDALSYTSRPEIACGAHLATLHCAAVNDLFSLYKDRLIEGTSNFPSVMAPDNSLDSYWIGACETLRYTRELAEQLLDTCEELPGSDTLRQIATETWLEMMEGNVLFHLTVPRYREGVAIVNQLIDPELSPEESQRAFRNSFRPPGGVAA